MSVSKELDVKIKEALSFDGIDDYVAIPESPSLYSTEFTIAFWLKLTSYPAKYSRIISKTDGSSDGYSIVFDNSAVKKVYIAVRAGSGVEHNTAIFSKPLPNGIWRHYAFTSYGHKLIAYEDGAMLGQAFIKEKYEPNSIQDLTFGRTSTGLSDFASMVLSDVRYYDKALASKEVNQIYVGKSVTRNLAGHWKLDEGSGNTAIDSSKNENNGQISGAKYISNK
jgi:hypothetical protein